MLWLCGPSGVGKSTVAWELFSGLPGAGHVDIDQLGMCFPELPSDPGRTVLEARILGSVVANFAAAGAGCVIVSGYIDSRLGVHTEYLTRAALTVLRMRCDQPELRRRLEARARPGEHRESALREALALDRGTLAYPVLDTTGRTLAEVLAAVRDRWPAACPPGPAGCPPGPAGWDAPAEGRHHAPGEILWLCGATAVGKSTIGWAVAEQSRRAGHTTGFVDLQQIGFLDPASGRDPGDHRLPAANVAVGGQDAGDHRLKAANLAAVWNGFHRHGARRLVVVGQVEHHSQVRLYSEALPAATLILHRLHAGPDQLLERIRQRGLGGGPPVAGDALRGRPAAVLARAHQAAVAGAAAPDRAGLGDVRIDTDGRSVEALAREITRRAGW